MLEVNMYKFAKQKDVRELTKWCDGIINEVQKEVKKYVTFSFNLIGSGGKKLVTQNGDEAFDLDYNLIIQKDKQGLIDDPKRLKDIIRHAFDIVLKEELEGYSGASDSTSVLKISITDRGKKVFSFDVAIYVEADNGFVYRLIHDKNTGRYIWNQVPKSKNYEDKIQAIKENGEWEGLKERYLELKNMHLRKGDRVKSFSIFLEALNEFYR